LLPEKKLNQKPKAALDSRYEVMTLDLETRPNEYDIQTLSGVYDTLSNMPFFDNYEPKAVEEKQTYFYDFWARTTL